MPVVVVTDSSARIPLQQRKESGIRIIPLHVIVDGVDLRDGIDDVPVDLYTKGSATTAGATPEELASAYRVALADSNGDGVVAVHISQYLSSTLNTAEQAAREFGGMVRVIDSKSTGMGIGFVALAAARAAVAGAELNAVAAKADSTVRETSAYIVVRRLENLRRSGRIGAAASWLGTALAMKPVLRIDDSGRLVLAQRVRTASRAIATMVEQVLDVVGERRARLAVHHVNDLEGAAQLAATLASALPACGPAMITDLGPVLGVHVGAGALGVVVQLRDTVVDLRSAPI